MCLKILFARFSDSTYFRVSEKIALRVPYKNPRKSVFVLLLLAGIISNNMLAQVRNAKLLPKPVDSTENENKGKTMEEVVVTGFQKIDRRKFSGAVASVTMAEVKLEGQTDVSRMLEGRVAGVSVQTVSGTFGAAPKIRIRGATSLTGDNKPLWVVDGVILEDPVNISNDQLSSGDPTTLLGSAIAGLNANDITGMSILKDAAATALYGARAMNGVVVITTKSGKSGKLSISYSVNLSTLLKPSYRNFNIMDSRSQMEMYQELENKGWLNYTDISLRQDAGVYGKLADEINRWDPATKKFGIPNTEAGRRSFLERYAGVNTDWFNLLFKNQLMQEHSLSISGGSAYVRTYFSLSFYRDAGWTIADNVNRYTLNFKNTYKINRWLSAWFNTVASFRQQRAPGSEERKSNSVRGSFDRLFDINPFNYALNTSRTLTPYDDKGELEYFRRNYAPFNIINELKNNYIDITMLDLKLQGGGDIKFSKHLRLETLAMIRYVTSNSEHNIKENTNQVLSYRAAETSVIRRRNRLLFRNPELPDLDPEVVLPNGGFFNTKSYSLYNWDVRNNLVFDYDFGAREEHSLKLLAGWNIRSVSRYEFSNIGIGYQFEKGGVANTDYRIIRKNLEGGFPYFSHTQSFDRFVAFFITASYSYDKRYNIGVNGRVDGSNKLGESPTARWLPTYSAEASWNIEQEKFMSLTSYWLNNLKLRASYGLTASLGNATNATAIYRGRLANRPYTEEQETVTVLSALENRNLTWEKLNTFDIGVDAGLFKRRLSFSYDYYLRKSFSLIDQVKTSGIGGELYKNTNFADMKSWGMEVTLVGVPVHLENGFKWTVTYTMGMNRTYITRADNLPSIFNLVSPEGFYKQGYPVRGLFSIVNDGLDPNTGVPRFIDEKGRTGRENVNIQSTETAYLKYEGPVDPVYTGGLNNGFTWQGITFNVFISFQAGSKIRLRPLYDAVYSDLDAMPRDFYTRQTLPGQKGVTPSISDRGTDNRRRGSNYPYNNYNFSSERVVDGSFVRFKTVSLAYTLPAAWTDKIRMKGITVQFTANNLFLIYSDKRLEGQDPEFFASGGVALPIQKQITFTLTTRF